jgi:hypothetical protein
LRSIACSPATIRVPWNGHTAQFPATIRSCRHISWFGSVGNNFLGAAPGHPVIARALQQAVESINRGDRDVIWLSTGPGMMTRVLAQCLADPAGAEELLRSSLLLEPGQLNRAVAVHCRLNYKKTKLHWRHGAFARGSGAPGKTASIPPAIRRVKTPDSGIAADRN